MPKITNRSVVEDRARGEIEEESPERKKWRALDWFASPPWSARAGAEIVKDIDPDARTLWEPACGDGIMARCIIPYFSELWASDIEPQGYGRRHDFLRGEPFVFPNWIITNPPYGYAQQFVERALQIANSGVAVLCRTSFIETVGRYNLHNNWLTDFCPFSERVDMQLGPWNPECASMTSYSWFIYHKERRFEAITRGGSRCRIIPPGTKERLWLADDVKNFCKPAPAPLFDGID